MSIVWGPHMYMLSHGSHIHVKLELDNVGSPYLQYMGFTHSMLCWGLYTEYSVGSISEN